MERFMWTWKIIHIRNGGIRRTPSRDTSDFSRRLLFLASLIEARYISHFWVAFQSFDDEPRRATSLDPWSPHTPEILTWARRQSITGGCWNQPKCRSVGFLREREERRRCCVTSRAKDDGCFPRRWWRFTSWRRQDQDRNFRTKEAVVLI